MSIDNCNGFVYVVQEDDSLYSISRRFNISLSWLINANVNNDIYNLFLGKRICIPNRDPYIDVIPIIPIRPWPGNIGGPGPVEPFKNTNPYTSGPKFDPRDPRYGTENPFGRIGDADEDDEYTSVVYEDDDDNDDFASTDLEAEEKVTENTSDNQTVETTDREEDMWTSDDYDVDYDRSATGNNDRMMNTDPRYPMYDERTNDPRYPIYD
ncbi:MAG: LysM domain-containing protein, partial [bacterium]|nr:LysM domain-containing protein [bacterium]